VYIPGAYGVAGETVLERRWVDADGNQWATDDRPLTPETIVRYDDVR
jgi:hypothetical protein